MSLCADVLNSRDFEPFPGEIFPEDYISQGLFLHIWTASPSGAEDLRSVGCFQSCRVAVQQAPVAG